MKRSVGVLLIGLIIAVLIAVFLLGGQGNGAAKNTVNSTGLKASLGNVAPDTTFALPNASAVNLSQYRGKTVLLWFVSTWCSPCAQGNAALDQNMNFFKSRNVTVIEVETYRNLGYSGPSISGFLSTYAPGAYANKSITIGTSSYGMMATYDSEGYPDIYYLIAKNGTVVYINGSPGATMDNLKAAIDAL